MTAFLHSQMVLIPFWQLDGRGNLPSKRCQIESEFTIYYLLAFINTASKQKGILEGNLCHAHDLLSYVHIS
jgi:hypothetical protein